MTEIALFDGLIEASLSAWSTVCADTSVWDALRQAQGALPALRLDCGRDDFLIDANRHLHQRLQAAGIAHIYEEFPGGHDWPYWAEHLPGTLRFFAAVLAQPSGPP